MARTKTVTQNKLEENVYKTASKIKPDVKLSEEEQKTWDMVVNSMKVGFFAEADKILILEYIKLQNLSNRAYEELKSENTLLTQGSSGALGVNKLVATINQCAGTMATISQKLGIAPSARVRHEGKVKKPEVVSEFEGMLD